MKFTKKRKCSSLFDNIFTIIDRVDVLSWGEQCENKGAQTWGLTLLSSDIETESNLFFLYH